jgi:hypothetical protein
MAKTVSLETRFQTLQLLLIEFSMKLNAFVSILNLKLRGISLCNFYTVTLLLMIFGM